MAQTTSITPLRLPVPCPALQKVDQWPRKDVPPSHTSQILVLRLAGGRGLAYRLATDYTRYHEPAMTATNPGSQRPRVVNAAFYIILILGVLSLIAIPWSPGGVIQAPLAKH